MAVDGPHADSGMLGHRVDRRGEAFGREDFIGRVEFVEDALAVPDGV